MGSAVAQVAGGAAAGYIGGLLLGGTFLFVGLLQDLMVYDKVTDNTVKAFNWGYAIGAGGSATLGVELIGSAAFDQDAPFLATLGGGLAGAGLGALILTATNDGGRVELYRLPQGFLVAGLAGVGATLAFVLTARSGSTEETALLRFEDGLRLGVPGLKLAIARDPCSARIVPGLAGTLFAARF